MEVPQPLPKFSVFVPCPLFYILAAIAPPDYVARLFRAVNQCAYSERLLAFVINTGIEPASEDFPRSTTLLIDSSKLASLECL